MTWVNDLSDTSIGFRLPKHLKAECLNLAYSQKKTLSYWAVEKLYEAVERETQKPIKRESDWEKDLPDVAAWVNN